MTFSKFIRSFRYNEREKYDKNGGIDRFLKNYEFICDGAGIPMDFYHHILTNKVLKNRFSRGFICKEEFFARVFN